MVTMLITYNSDTVNLNNGLLIFVDVLAIILISGMLIFILYNETLQFAHLLFFFLSQDSRHECKSLSAYITSWNLWRCESHFVNLY